MTGQEREALIENAYLGWEASFPDEQTAYNDLDVFEAGWKAALAARAAALTAEEFYERTAWPVGTLVGDALDPSRVGAIVKRGGRLWVSRDKLPMVRWDGKIDAEKVEWERLTQKAVHEDTERPDPAEELARKRYTEHEGADGVCNCEFPNWCLCELGFTLARAEISPDIVICCDTVRPRRAHCELSGDARERHRHGAIVVQVHRERIESYSNPPAEDTKQADGREAMLIWARHEYGWTPGDPLPDCCEYEEPIFRCLVGGTEQEHKA